MKALTQYLLPLLFLLLPGLAPAQFGMGDDLLEPEKAFALDARMQDADTLVAEWQIADGYYLYREKFEFASETAGIRLGEPRIPRGKLKKDEFFGEVETFRGSVRIEIPLLREAGAPTTLALRTVSQGCADIGVCYPPLTQKANLELPAAAAPAATAAEAAPATRSDPLSALSRLAKGIGNGLGGSDDELLPPEQAFFFTLEPIAPDAVRVRWEVAKGYYLYREKIAFRIQEGEGTRIGDYQLPRGEEKDDEFFGRTEILRGDVEVVVPLLRAADAAPYVVMVAEYQGCADMGVCYPPMTREVGFEPASATGPVTAGPTAAASAVAPAGGLSEQDQIAARLASGKIWLTILAFFGFGLLLAFTPCVFPMIPILSGIIVGQGKGLTTRRAFVLSLVYVLAMALTYTVAGVLVGMSGQNVQVWFQNPWVLSVFAVVFVLLSLSMFGFYELQMPNFLQSKLAEASNRQRGGTLGGVAVMGFLSALIVGPCVTAPLVGALIYIAQTGDAVLGGLALFSLSMGMGAPLLVLGTSAGKLMPRAGAWMDAVKAVFGVMLLGVAIWMLERILPVAITMGLWGVLLIVSGIYMGALEHIRDGASGWRRLWKGLGLALALWGALMLIAAAAGGKDLLQPLRGIVVAGGGAGAEKAGLQFRYVKGVDGLESALAEARAQGRPVMLDFYADWCISCKEMERFTFSDPAVQSALSGFLLLKTDVTANDAADQALLKHFGLFGPPAILFYDRHGNELRNFRVVGFVPADRFAAHANQVTGI
ncbi:MAG: protein-disulfide reductase DsbD [Chromatiales bacterium]|nr:protein-disulfide reductase DsbD [Chromatiales bacterium]